MLRENRNYFFENLIDDVFEENSIDIKADYAARRRMEHESHSAGHKYKNIDYKDDGK